MRRYLPYTVAQPLLAMLLAGACACGTSSPARHDGAVDVGQPDGMADDGEEATTSAEADAGSGDSTLDATDSADAAQPPDGQLREAAPEAGMGCNRSASFGAPVLLPGPNINTPATEGGPHLTADELTLYFSRDTGSGSDLYVAHRASIADDFGPPNPLTTVNSTANELDPTTVNELTLFFTSDRSGANHLWVSTRANTAIDFAPPTELPAPINSAQGDAQPFLRADGSELWFASNRANTDGNYDIYVAAAAGDSGSSFGAPMRVAELSSPSEDYTPTLSGDGLVVFFASSRASPSGDAHIWTASRAPSTDLFGNVQAVPELNSSSSDYAGWLSVDGCRFYMSSTRAGSEDIYVATRGP